MISSLNLLASLSVPFTKSIKYSTKRIELAFSNTSLTAKDIERTSTSGFLQPVCRISEMCSRFYVTLFLNSSMKAYPDNKI